MKTLKGIIGLIIVLTFMTGCTQLQQLATVATTTVTPTEAIVASNAYDAIEAGATSFLTFCKSNPTNTNCGAGNRRSVISYTRSGRAARNQIETYIQSSSTIPAAIYNTLVTAVNNLKTTPAANYVGAQ